MMNSTPFGLPAILILMTGFSFVYLTSAWSPLSERKRLWVACFGIAAAYLTSLPGLACAKSELTVLAGEYKPGIFYCWAFGLWFALKLLRHTQTGSKVFGVFSLAVCGLLLAWCSPKSLFLCSATSETGVSAAVLQSTFW